MLGSNERGGSLSAVNTEVTVIWDAVPALTAAYYKCVWVGSVMEYFKYQGTM